MAIPTYETLPRELQFGVSMIVFAIFMLLTIRWLAKRHKPTERQKDYALVAFLMLLIGVLVIFFLLNFVLLNM